MSNVRPWHMIKNDGAGEKTSQEVSDNRMSICEECPSLKAGFCMECGCRMKWKTTLRFAACPLGKWGQE